MKVLVVTVLAFVTLAQAEVDRSTVRPNHRHVHPIRPAPAPKVVGGQEAEPHGIPFQVSVLRGGGFCGGSIIAPNVVLTAAHCVDGAYYVEITAGAHNLQEKEDTQQIMNSCKTIVHPKWDSWSLRNDIAILYLCQNITFGDTAAAVALNGDSSSLDGEEAVVSGWGRPSDSVGTLSPVLRYAVEKIISNTECEFYFGNSVQEANVCLDGRNGKGSCNGDSGGPLVITRNGKPVQAGVVSFGSSAGCEAGYPSAFTRVSNYVSWINENLP